jgi:predicted site-specific integrase-resolvase
MKYLVSIITSFCCRLYGLRRGKNKAKDIRRLFGDKDVKT